MNFEIAIRKAQVLGVEMAKLGFHLEDNPYTDINPKLEATWSDGYGKYCAMCSLAQTRAQEQEEAARAAAGRKRVRGGEKQRQLCPC